MDLITWLGLAIGVGGIVIGNSIEGGSIASLVQLTAALIVFGGTFGAVLVSSGREELRTARRLLRLAFFEERGARLRTLAAEMVRAAQVARKDSILALEPLLAEFSEPFTRRVLRLVIDGAEPRTLREIIEPEIATEEEHLLAGARVWSDAGGFAPTIGIIGAVLGLISVMTHISNTSELGKGIAVAFVATIYGVASANLVFLPLANKIKRRVKKHVSARYMVLEGAISIASGLNPYVIQEKMSSYFDLPESVARKAS